MEEEDEREEEGWRDASVDEVLGNSPGMIVSFGSNTMAMGDKKANIESMMVNVGATHRPHSEPIRFSGFSIFDKSSKL